MTRKEIKNIEKSIRSRLFSLAGHQQLSYQMLIIRYAHERLLYRLSRSIYRERFYLKGGVLLYAFDRDNARPTVDIDFSSNRIGNDIAQIKSVFTEICKINDAPDGIRFDMDEIQAAEINENRVYKGIRLVITARMDTIIQPLSVDIGFGDIVIPYANELDYPLLLPELPIPRIFVYSMETVIAEKFQAMIELSETNSRMKDFYDL
ncbi:nucleotidyl transferase AbiEii/AbiGii toxin family protein, partial [uncultured Proteiniphilum sp.]|uniref:nucleotidyl transferase AbiEii/AbiGii toxin family protein n=1 Tax=uncultured Proteiniphilum sp. TaxID=497637 RepID=UPI00260F8B59